MEGDNRNLNEILESVNEIRHLSELIKHRSKDMKGAAADEIMNKVIHPTLDDLELYLRYYGKPGISERELKDLVHAWIEAQMTV